MTPINLFLMITGFGIGMLAAKLRRRYRWPDVPVIVGMCIVFLLWREAVMLIARNHG